jgi:hypothetical protein
MGSEGLPFPLFRRDFEKVLTLDVEMNTINLAADEGRPEKAKS